MDFIEMDFIDDAERSQPEQEIEMILQATRVDMTRLSILLDEITGYRKHIYHEEAIEVIALLLLIFDKYKEKDND